MSESLKLVFEHPWITAILVLITLEGIEGIVKAWRRDE